MMEFRNLERNRAGGDSEGMDRRQQALEVQCWQWG